MTFNSTLLIIVIVSFSIIHFVEITSFLARLAGVIGQNKALAYATQSAVFMLTRFFSMMMLPVLGLIVDMQVSKSQYIAMCSIALFCAFLSSLLALSLRGRTVPAFEELIRAVKSGKSLMGQIIQIPVLFFQVKKIHLVLPKLKNCISDKIFLYASLVFSIYAISLFFAFFFSLLIPEYRASISQLSGMINAFATLLLTFYLEPRISISIDKNENAHDLLLKLVIGRIFGIGIISQIFLFTLTFLFK